ncbi:MAG: hypothetical protein B1H13_11945 [Desulfobacteraceae bacterium 4484_190.3]|nr:MAG: hypothetical protein B1H13_11945 [Desulfobacteraceae bacterium 4484_190.3]
MFGHDLAEAFKAGLKKYKPDAQIVGEAYHPLFAYDYAPYLTKIKASGAQVIFSGDWPPDSGNLLKQSRQMGMMLPFANIFMDEPNSLAAVGPDGTVGLVHADLFMPSSAPGIQEFLICLPEPLVQGVCQPGKRGYGSACKIFLDPLSQGSGALQEIT